MKYDFDLDMDTDNSCSLILREVKANSKVLEFGPAYGRMTKYLKEQLNCDICIIEKDYESGNSAQKFAAQSFIGDSSGDGNADNNIWYHSLTSQNKKFNHILFADVLEHLYDPWIVLKRAVDLLEANGTILISVPNISHNSVIIDLMNDKFEYRPTGLLDNTHIRFFTYTSLRNMIENSGLIITKEMNAHCAIEHTEFRNNINDIPGNVGRFLNKRKFGDTYQFVWELKKND